MRVRDKVVSPAEAACAAKLRKSIVLARDVPAGRELVEADLAIKSPGTGIEPLAWDDVLGRVTLRPLAEDDQLAWDDLAPRAAGAAKAGGAA
jgi:sialic acid synthase SpsE